MTILSNLIYKDESMCVCGSGGRRAHTSHHPKIWHGFLISPWLGTEPGGDPNCWPPGVPPILTPSEIPWRVKNWAGTSKQKLLFRVGLPKIFLGGVHPKLGPTGSTPPSRGICIDNWAGASKKKLLLKVGLLGKILFVGGLTPTPGLQGPLHQIGVFALIILRGPANKSCSSGWVCLVKFYLWGGSPQPWARRVHSTKWGY